MNITVYTSIETDWIANHQINCLCREFDNVKIVAVDRNHQDYRKERLLARKKLITKRGIKWFLSKWIDNFYLKSLYNDWNTHLSLAREKEIKLHTERKFQLNKIVSSVNGKNSELAIIETQPDIIVQAGAGILKANIFEIPSISTVNVHGAIAPRLRGGSSIFWTYYYGRPDWLGVTIHQIDKGIDTGAVYKREYMQYTPGIHPTNKVVESAITGTSLLCEVLGGIQKNNIIAKKIDEESTYLGFYNSSQYKELKKNNWYPLKQK